MGVQEVSDAVERDRRLAGAGAALDDQEALVGGADDAVLLGLDGRHDVTHAPVARLAQGMHEGALALQLQALGVRGVEQLVLQAGHAPVASRNVAATHDALRLSRRRLIEGTRGGGTPIHEQGSAVLVRQGQATNVARRRIHHVEATEHEALLHALQARGHLTQVRGQGLALRPRLRVSDTVRRMNAALTIPVGGAKRVETLVGGVDEVLFRQRKVRA